MSEDQMKAFMRRVREEAMRRQGRTVSIEESASSLYPAEAQRSSSSIGTAQAGEAPMQMTLPQPIQLYLPDLKSQGIAGNKKHFKPSAENRYRIQDFLVHEDGDFIDIAYRGLLGRLPDEEGRKHYLSRLRDGTDKVDILSSLRFSREGARLGATVKGLKRARALSTIFRLPIVGRLIRTVATLWELDRTLRAQRVRLGRVMRDIDDERNTRQELAHVVYRALRSIENHGNELRRFAESRAGQGALDAVASQSVVAANAAQSSVTELRQSMMALQESRVERVMLDSVRNELEQALRESVQRLTRDFQEVTGRKADHKGLEELRVQVENIASSHHMLRTQIHREEHPLQDAMYAHFEERFRGNREDVKSRQGIYIDRIREAATESADVPIIDLGCGRGEWLELLREKGLSGRGVDENHLFVQGCQALGLDVEQSDVIAFLQRCGTGTVGGVTAFHLIEHLSVGKMVALFDEVLRVLRPHGVAIFETPNPANLQVGANTFYLDPTHRNPLPGPMVQYLLEAQGFVSAEIIALHPYEPQDFLSDLPTQSRAFLNQLLFGARDYAVIARKG